MGEAATRSPRMERGPGRPPQLLGALEIGTAFIDDRMPTPLPLPSTGHGQNWPGNFCTRNCPFQASAQAGFLLHQRG